MRRPQPTTLTFALAAAISLQSGCSLLTESDADRLKSPGAVPGADAAVDGAMPADGAPPDATDAAMDAATDAELPDATVPDPDAGTCVGGCDDGFSCTVDGCVSGACVHDLVNTACDDGVACTRDRCDPALSSDLTGCVFEPTPACDASAEDCMDPGAIVLAAGRATVVGEISEFGHDYSTICSTAMGPDAVYAIDVVGLQDVYLDTSGSTADTVVAVATSCTTAGFRAGCHDDVDDVDLSSKLVVRGFDGGPMGRRLYVLVSGAVDGATGSFTLHVETRTPVAAACAAPIDLGAGGALVAAVRRLDSLAAFGSCQNPVEYAEHEIVVRVDGPADGNLSALALSRDFAPDLYMRQTDCLVGRELGCQRGRASGSVPAPFMFESELRATASPDSSVHVFVDGAAMTGNVFLTVRR